jgi:type IX secretion system PorP/SprF family membrane protein
MNIGNNIKYLKFILLLFMAADFGHLHAQQEWNYTQYLFNLYDINSAYAGNHNTGSFALRHRSQWMGMEGAPVSQQLSFHAPFREKLGLGVKLNNERIGAREQQTMRVSAAWKLKLRQGVISLGLAGGIIRHGIRVNQLTALDENDIQLLQLNQNVIVPVADFSAFYSSKNFYVGFDCGRINRSRLNHQANSLARLYFNSSLVAGWLKKVGESNLLQISGLMKYSEGRLWQAEINLLYLHQNKFWIGGGYRFQSSFQILAALNLSDHFRLGLSYDIAGKSTREFHDGSAEVFLGYTIKSRSGKSVRYF